MKKNIYMALLCITSIAFSQEQKSNESLTANATLTFGRYGKDCSGRGICSFSISADQSVANALATYNKNKTLTLTIYRDKLSADERYKIVGNYSTLNTKISEPVFVMDEALKLSTSVKNSLRKEASFNEIVKDNYTIKVTEETYVITLKLE